MSGTLSIGNKEIFSHSDATDKVTYGSGIPAGSVIGTSYYKANEGTWEIDETETNWWEFTVTKKQSSSHLVVMMTTVVRIDGGSSGGAGLYLGVRRSTTSTPVTTSDTLVFNDHDGDNLLERHMWTDTHFYSSPFSINFYDNHTGSTTYHYGLFLKEYNTNTTRVNEQFRTFAIVLEIAQ